MVEELTPLGLVTREAVAARAALHRLSDAAVGAVLEVAAGLLRERRGEVLRASEGDVSAATGKLDEGALDRLRLDDDRIEAIARGLEATAELAPIDREVRTWTLPNGLQVSERLVPVGGSGPSTAALARQAALNGVRTLAHAEGGGVLYVHEAASLERLVDVARASLDRLGVCNRLNLALVDARARGMLSTLLEIFREHD